MSKTITITKSRDSAIYKKAFKHFKKQWPNIFRLECIYLDDDGKVYAGEWLDQNQVTNFNGGYAPDVKYEIVFEDYSQVVKIDRLINSYRLEADQKVIHFTGSDVADKFEELYILLGYRIERDEHAFEKEQNL